jgi:hypothetical protein
MGGSTTRLSHSLNSQTGLLRLADWASRDSFGVSRVRPPVSSLKSTALTTVCKMAIVFGFADCVYSVYRVLSLRSYLFNSTSSTAFSFPCHFLRLITVMARTRVTADELKARPKANSYQRGAHGEEDGFEACNRHVDMVAGSYPTPNTAALDKEH